MEYRDKSVTLQTQTATELIHVMSLGAAWDAPAAVLAQQLALPLATQPTAALCLELGAEGLSLRDPSGMLGGAVRVDFVQGDVGYRLRKDEGRRQPLGRAIGLKPGYNPRVVDATAGLGRDGVMLAKLGCQVTLVERSPVILALLQDGLARGQACAELRDTLSRVTTVGADACAWLGQLTEVPDVVYLDPMFPHREKRALVKKEMRLFRMLVGDDLDADALLQIALGVAKRRVVVKRPRPAPPLNARAPSHTLEGQSTRFDVYVVG
jgi:16S rRNA (guanine1516-N2)-methyltransferase